MKLFKTPSWLKPEVNEPKYYLHLGVIAFVVLALLQYFLGGDMLSLNNVLLSIPLLLAGDIVAHTVLRLD